MKHAITDVPGIKVGHFTHREALTGCTVVLCEAGAAAGVDVRGSAPGTRETDLLSPLNMVEKVHAIMLSGGSAFGLDAAGGAMQYLEEKGCGFDVGVTTVPIVPSAVIFDLLVGDHRVRPDKAMGYAACLQATDGEVAEGNVGAGTGATVGKVLGHHLAMQGGVGTSSRQAGDLLVGALVVVNAFGDIVDPATGEIIAGALKPDRSGFVDTIKQMMAGQADTGKVMNTNTTVGVVATNARLTKSQANKVAQMAHNGYARTIRPVHTMFDGDTIFALSTGDVEADVSVVGTLAAEVMAAAVVRAVKVANKLI